MERIYLIATAPFGLEAVVEREVQALGYDDLFVENGRVTFAADSSAIARANLWLRTADRLLVQVGEFQATTFEELFEKTKALPWEQWIPRDGAFPVEGKSLKSQLSSVPACQSIVKKAIVERLKAHYHCQWFDETGPRFTVEVSILKDVVTLTIDTSGAGLHKRGYRKLSAKAPLKETLAAAMVLLSRWNPGRPLADPFCGSGTIPIEAALIGRNIAPGLHREFDAMFWPTIPNATWNQSREEALDLMRRSEPMDILGTDIDAEPLSLARYHAKAAGVADTIVFAQQPVSKFHVSEEYGCIITNPPYGERLGNQPEVRKIYQDLTHAFKPLRSTWSIFVITSVPNFEKLYLGPATKRRKLYNGRIECTLYQYFGPFPPRTRNAVPQVQTETP